MWKQIIYKDHPYEMVWDKSDDDIRRDALVRDKIVVGILQRIDLPPPDDNENRIVMTDEERRGLQIAIIDEGFDYCFDSYSSWGNIRDSEFHMLRQKYLAQKQLLYNYIFHKRPNNDGGE